MVNEKEIAELIKSYADAKDWVSIDILCQMALGIEWWDIKENLRKSFPETIDIQSRYEKVCENLKKIGVDNINFIPTDIKELILKEIDEKLGKTLMKRAIEKIKKSPPSVTNALYLFSALWLKEQHQTFLPFDSSLNSVYYATFGYEQSFEMDKKLIETGIVYRSITSSRKHTYLEYVVPPHNTHILRNIDKYIKKPQITDPAEYIKQEEQNNNIAQLMFLDLATRDVDYRYMRQLDDLKTIYALSYPGAFNNPLHSKPGIVYVTEYGTTYFSPITYPKLRDEIVSMKKRMAEPLKDIFLKAISVVDKNHPPVNKTLDFNHHLGAYVGFVDFVGIENYVGVFISPWIIWCDYNNKYDLYVINQYPSCIILTSDKIRPSIVRDAVCKHKNISFISITKEGNFLLSTGGKNQLVDELVQSLAEIGYRVEEISERELAKMFPLCKDAAIRFAVEKYSYDEIKAMGRDWNISLSTTTKQGMAEELCEKLGLEEFAKKIGYPVFEKKGESKEKKEAKERKVQKEQKTTSPSQEGEAQKEPKPVEAETAEMPPENTIVVGSDEMPEQWGIIGTSSDGKKVVIDLNAPHIVFVSGMMGAGKGYTIGTIVEMLVSKGIKNLCHIPKRATVIVLYKPRDDVPSEFWSIRYPNDVKKETEVLKEYDAEPMAPIKEDEFKVFLDPDVYEKHRKTFETEYKTKNISPIYIDPSTLCSEDWANALVTGGGNEALYLREIYNVLNELPDNFSSENVVEKIDESGFLTENQKRFAKSRLRILKKYLEKDDFVDKLILGGVNIFDFRKILYMPADIFTIMTIILSKLQNKKDFSDIPFVFIMNEAHLYFKDISKDFVDTLENLIRRKRHGANWLLLDTHLPDDVDRKVIELSDIKILHQTDKAVDSPVLRRIVEGRYRLDKLNPGEAIVCANKSSLGQSVPIWVKIRPRISKHGGATKTAVKED